MAKKKKGHEKKSGISIWQFLGKALSIFTAFFLWFATGLPFSLVPKWQKWTVATVAVAEGADIGRTAISWNADLLPDLTPELIAVGIENGVHPDALSGMVKASALERSIASGLPEAGTGLRVDMYTIGGIGDIESSLDVDSVNPEEKNVTGGCNAVWELMHHPLLDGVKEVNALRQIAKAQGLNLWKIKGSCGAGCVGWNQSLPTNWIRLMGPEFDPWNREHAQEFTARYLVADGDYFTMGREHAIRAYNPNASDAEYLQPVLARAAQLQTAFEEAELAAPEVELRTSELTLAGDEETEENIVEVELEEPTTESVTELDGWPVPLGTGRTGVPFGAPSSYQPQGHSGIDLGVSTGTPIKSVGSGVVVYVGWFPQQALWKLRNIGHGNTVIVYHGVASDGDPVYSYYAHLSEFAVETGEYVQEGDIVGLSGNTGASSGPHLHFAIRKGGGIEYDGADADGRDWSDGQWVDPDLWVNNTQGGGEFELTAEVPIRGRITGGTSREVTVILLNTPSVEFAAWLGKVSRAAEQGVAILERTPIPEVVRETERVSTLTELLESISSAGKRWYVPVSTLAIAGQPKELGLNPLVDWAIISIGEETDSPFK
ncbi:M23 family metallopeptidase [Patescibacteria group bacterium]|nr:M23 family metallopeptidase [Patescibacteria group bacterium]